MCPLLTILTNVALFTFKVIINKMSVSFSIPNAGVYKTFVSHVVNIKTWSYEPTDDISVKLFECPIN